MEGFGATLRWVSDYAVDFLLKHILLLSSKLHIPTKKPAGYKSPMKSVICILIRNVMIPEITSVGTNTSRITQLDSETK